MNLRAKPYENPAPALKRLRDVRSRRRADGVCVNSDAHGPVYKGSRCYECWVKKLDAERLLQPDGTLKARAKWNGPLPAVGDYLQSPMRPRHAYKITGVAVTGFSRLYIREDDQEYERELNHATFTLERVGLDEVPPGATIHEWRWDPRGRKRGPKR